MAVARQTIQTLLGHLLVFGQGLLLTPVVIRVAGPETFGAYVLLISYLGIVFGVSSFGVGVSAKRWLPSMTNAVERAAKFFPQFVFQMLSVCVLAAISSLAYLSIADSANSRLPNFPVWMLVVYLCVYTVYSQMTDYFRYTHRIGFFNAATVGQPYFFIALAYVTYKVTGILSLTSLIGSLIVSCSVVAAILCIELVREIGFRFRLPAKKDLGQEIKLGLPLVLAYLVDVSLASGDRFLIAAVLSIHDVGVYVPAYALGSLALVIPKVFGVILPPLISRRVDSGDIEGAKRLSERAIQIFLWVSVPYSIGAAMLGKEILALYAGDEVAEIAWMVVPIVSCASIFYGLILIKSNILYIRMKTRILFEINLISAVLNIALNLVLLSLFGNVIAAAVATLISYVLSYVLLIRKFRCDEIDVSINFKWALNVLLCACGMAGVLALTKNYVAEGRGIIVFLNVLIGGVVYLLFGMLSSRNRQEVWDLYDSMRQRK